MKGVHPPSAYPRVDLVAGCPEVEELASRHNSELPGGQAGDSPIQPIGLSFSVYMTVNLNRALRAPRKAAGYSPSTLMTRRFERRPSNSM